MKNSVAKLGMACAFCALLVVPASALDTDSVLQRLEATLSANNLTVKGGTVTSDGNNIIVENFGLEAASLNNADNLTLRMNDIVEGEDGSFTIGRFSVDDASVEINGEKMDFAGLEVEQMYLPAESQPLYGNGYQPYKSIKLKNFTLYEGGKPVFRGDNSYAQVSEFEVGKLIKYQGAVESFSFSADDLGVEPAQGLKAVGYETVSGKVDFTGGVDYQSGLLDIENFAFSFDNMGTLSMKLQVGGYTSEVAQALAEMQAVGDEQAQGLAMLAVGQKLNFNSFSLRFDDDSITNKALDEAAKNMGSSRQEVASMAVAMAQFGLANIQHADFSAKVSQALESYLNDPRSLEVVAAPAQPLPFMAIAGGAQDPKQLIDLLNVEVKANSSR